MRKTNTVQVHISSLDDMGKRFSNAWNRAATGKKVYETHVAFLDIKTMLDTLSPRRLEMLKFVRHCGAGSVKKKYRRQISHCNRPVRLKHDHFRP
jgi:predicted transcriptional regulator